MPSIILLKFYFQIYSFFHVFCIIFFPSSICRKVKVLIYCIIICVRVVTHNSNNALLHACHKTVKNSMSIISLLLLITVSNTWNLLKGRQSSDVLEYTCSSIVSAIFNVINDIKKTQRPRRMSRIKTGGRDRA